MARVMDWLQQHENQVFLWVNQRKQITFIDIFMQRITHLGGASATIAVTLCLSLFAHDFWRMLAIQALIALAVSHIPVAIFKKKYPRLRPYLVLPQTRTCKNPLADHSFPSGHTTAIFASIVPFALHSPFLALALLPVAFTVAYSRVYLGLHYPSDCAVGAMLGTSSAILASVFV
ncbi:phosphatase PAP2 family protein [Paenibacillus psychroresistens]|uniref:Phosphatase PAP2 family protein n=1 Tax=Paenibacillus psychroresistens TaxID=1778678 RepID=A0A6B8RRW1_9BACL|nr:phosphatase PAP2 family protein [Paenibacillus psychroresistens]QGQ98126.1 phosphatase PAP2 family protein [Paenibacillus psychroresistens]